MINDEFIYKTLLLVCENKLQGKLHFTKENKLHFTERM